MRRFFLPLLPLALSSCVVASVANTAVDIVKLPVQAVSKGVDLATTSQSEADENRGRALRKAEEEAGKHQRLWAEACQKTQARGEPCLPAPTSEIQPVPPAR